MKSFAKLLAVAAFAISAPMLSMSASAYEGRDALNQPTAPLTGAISSAQSKLPVLASKDTKTKNIVVAGRRGRGIAAGIFAGIAAAAILSHSARAHHYDDGYRYRSRSRNRCERWYRKCEYGGRRWACRKYDRHCGY